MISASRVLRVHPKDDSDNGQLCHGVVPQAKDSAIQKESNEPHQFTNFKSIVKEVMKATGGMRLEDIDMDARVYLHDRFLFVAENRISAMPMIPYYALFVLVLLLALGLAFLWYRILLTERQSDPQRYSNTMGRTFDEAFFLAVQVFMAAGYIETDSHGLRIVYIMMLLGGILAFAVLVGFVTDGVSTFMTNMSSGLTKVSQSGHTLILGWNEATVRVVCQLSQLRGVHWKNNRTWARRFCWWLRVRASTPVAVAQIVIMCNEHEKTHMDRMIEAALSERNISSKHTRVGIDIICRVGNPTNTHDLVRVGAHRATAILVSTTIADKEEETRSDGLVRSGQTIRCLLALRQIVISSASFNNPDLRIVAQLPGKVEAVQTVCFPNAYGEQVIYPLDLSVFLNSLMFSCSVQPRLPQLLVELLDFHGYSIRRRWSSELRVAGLTFREAVCALEDAVIIGLTRPQALHHKQDSACQNSENLSKFNIPEQGLCPSPDRKIQESDYLIFISETSNPQAVFDGRAKVKEYSEIAQSLKPTDETSRGQTSTRQVLVCGWRDNWTNMPGRLARRFTGLAEKLDPGSIVVFYNRLTPEEFAQIMDRSGFRRVSDETSVGVWDFGVEHTGISVTHVKGDAADLGDLRRVVLNTSVPDHGKCNFDTVIVLGTTSRSKLDGHSMDTRVLTILLFLRNIRDENPFLQHMHVISENNEDETAKLAVAPSFQGDTSAVADFVNTQAITARAIAQCLAYPKISDYVQDLINDSGTVNTLLVWAKIFVPLEQELKFGVVQEMVTLHKERAFDDTNDGAMAIGVVSSDDEVIYCWPEYRRKFRDGDRLICLIRQIT